MYLGYGLVNCYALGKMPGYAAALACTDTQVTMIPKGLFLNEFRNPVERCQADVHGLVITFRCFSPEVDKGSIRPPVRDKVGKGAQVGAPLDATAPQRAVGGHQAEGMLRAGDDKLPRQLERGCLQERP